MSRTKSLRWLGIAALAILLGIALAPWASYALADPINDVPAGLGESIGVSPEVAKIIISIGILSSIALVMALLKLREMGIVMVLLATIGCLVAVGYLDLWLLILLGIVVALAFGTKVAKAFGG